MRRWFIASILICLASLACGQQVVTSTPTSPAPSASATIPVPAATGTPSAVATVAEADTATVRAALVNVRANPGGEVIGQLVAGTDVLVLGYDDSGDWAHIEDPDGWVFVGCLSIADGKGCIAK